MEDTTGILVGRIFFMICALISLFGILKPEKMAKESLMYIKKYQFKNINSNPTLLDIKICRIISICSLCAWIILIIAMPGLLQ